MRAFVCLFHGRVRVFSVLFGWPEHLDAGNMVAIVWWRTLGKMVNIAHSPTFSLGMADNVCR